MKIVLTGSEGFIGSHLAEKIVKQGHDLTCLVLYNSFGPKPNRVFLAILSILFATSS